MKRKPVLKIALMLIIAMSLLAGVAFSEPMDIPEGSRCHLCGMKVNPASMYSAEFVRDGEMIPFCDIGDMLYQYGKDAEKPAEIYVRNSESGEWINALEAAYVKNDNIKSPMEWNIAAFASRGDAAKHGAPMTFEEALGMTGGGMKMKKNMKGSM